MKSVRGRGIRSKSEEKPIWTFPHFSSLIIIIKLTVRGIRKKSVEKNSIFSMFFTDFEIVFKFARKKSMFSFWNRI